MAPRKIDLTGNRYGRWLVIAFAGRTIKPSGGQIARWRCRCDCGNEVDVQAGHLVRGLTNSCGCLKVEQFIARNRKHGGYRKPEYAIWMSMKARCLRETDAAYSNYGGRGIGVFPGWVHSFEDFLRAVGERPTPQHSLDRIDNNGNYEPGNVRWATRKEQNRNTRTNRIVMIAGQSMSMAEAVERFNINRDAVRSRVRRGWTLERAIDQEFRR